MEKNDNTYGKTGSGRTGMNDTQQSKPYGQNQGQGSLKDRIADKIDSAATKVADKVHQTVAQHKSGQNGQPNDRPGQDGTKKTTGGCGCSAPKCDSKKNH